ncbi:hypothetical protein [Fusobacterium sp.]|uniref:hypothetical protein n=1 Tax=Fusobacterium sp. TaxID=68766 RepID=UPI00261C3A9B|nr:hypothetical protein [Fusobacterium sp.]
MNGLRNFLNNRTMERRKEKVNSISAFKEMKNLKVIRGAIYSKLIDSAEHSKGRVVINPIELRGFIPKKCYSLTENELFNLVFKATMQIIKEEDLDYVVEYIGNFERYRIYVSWVDEEISIFDIIDRD